jgi:Bacterial capsule synthesis protein PGA_cap
VRRGLAFLVVAGVLAAACGANQLPAAAPPSVETVLATPDSSAEQKAVPPPTDEATTTVAIAETTTTTVPRPEGTFTMAFSGDTLIHRPIVRQAGVYANGIGYEFAPMFERIKPLVSSVDLAVCHMETPVAPDGEELSGHPIYGVPKQVLAAVAGAGYDRCSSASNHSMDRGAKGVDATVDAIEANNLGNSGMARTPQEAEARTFVTRGINMSHLSYTWGTNGIPRPAGQEWRVRLLDANRIINDARNARSKGAEFVFVSLHWGEEKNWRITNDQRRLAEQLTGSGAIDLIIGHHVHVLQPIEEINGRWVVFGLSNLISNLPGGDEAWPASSQDGAVVTTEIARKPGGGWAIAKPVVHPTWVDHSNYAIRLVVPDINDPATPPGVVSELRNSLERTRKVLGDYLETGA